MSPGAGVLMAELQAQRRHIRLALAGLSQHQLATEVPPTSWTPAGLVFHLAMDVERWWFRAVTANDPQAWQYFERYPDGAWKVPVDVDALAVYDAECALADRILLEADFDAPAKGWPSSVLGPSAQSVAEIVLHVIVETSTHAGHLDIVRETLDGHQHLVLD